MKMHLIVAVAALGFGTLVGCGGVEDAELSESGELQSVSQGLCQSPPTGDCADTPVAVPTGLTCSHYGWNYKFTCAKKLSSACKLFKCTTGEVWSAKDVSGSCSTFHTSPWCI